MKPALALCGLWMAACTGEIPALSAQGDRVDIAGDVFTVSATDTTAVARNFATGLNNQARLLSHAALAIESATGCSVDTITQRPMLNTYDATLICAA